MAQFILLDTQPSIHTSRTACGLSEFPLGMASTSTSLLSIQSQSMTTSLCGKFSFLSQCDIIHQSSGNGRHQAHTVFFTQSCIQSSVDNYWEAVISQLLVMFVEDLETRYSLQAILSSEPQNIPLLTHLCPQLKYIISFGSVLWECLTTNLKKCSKLVKPFG